MKHTVCHHVNRLPHLNQNVGTGKGRGNIFSALLLKVWVMTHRWVMEDSGWVTKVLQIQKNQVEIIVPLSTVLVSLQSLMWQANLSALI